MHARARQDFITNIICRIFSKKLTIILIISRGIRTCITLYVLFSRLRMPTHGSKATKRSQPSSGSSTTTSTSTLVNTKRPKTNVTSRAPTTSAQSQKQKGSTTCTSRTAKPPTTTRDTTNEDSIADRVMNDPPAPLEPNPSILPEDLRSTATRSSPSPGDRSIPTTVVAHEVQELQHQQNEVSLMEKAVVQHVVTEQFFPEVKFVDKDTDLAWEVGAESFCQFFISKCNVPLNVDRREWWMRTRKLVAFTMTQTRNDRNTAVRNAFVGKYIVMSSIRIVRLI